MSLITSLKKIWNRAAFELESRGILAPCEDVKSELRRDGWSFETIIIPPHPRVGMGVGALTLAVTPEGRLVIDAKEDGERYSKAVRAASLRVHGPF